MTKPDSKWTWVIIIICLSLCGYNQCTFQYMHLCVVRMMLLNLFKQLKRAHLGRDCDRMVVGFLLMLWVRIPLRWGVLLSTLCDKVCQWLGFLQILLISATNKTDCHDITENFLKVALNTINQPSWKRPNQKIDSHLVYMTNSNKAHNSVRIKKTFAL